MGKSAEMGIFRAFFILWKRHVASSGDHMLARDIEPDHLRAEALGERGISLERALIVSKSGKQCCQPVHHQRRDVAASALQAVLVIRRLRKHFRDLLPTVSPPRTQFSSSYELSS